MNRNVIRAAIATLGLFAGGVALASPPTPLESFAPSAFFRLAQQRLHAADVDAAEHVLREGMAAHPREPGFHVALGEVLETRGQKAEAFYEYQWELLRTGAENPIGEAAGKSAAALVSKGDREIREVLGALQQMASDPSESRSRLAKVRADRGPRLILDLYVAEAARLAGDSRAAERGFRAVIERDPAFVPAYLELAGVLGDGDEARALVAKAASIDANHWSLVAAGGAK